MDGKQQFPSMYACIIVLLFNYCLIQVTYDYTYVLSYILYVFND
jgi:uncharacterized membrane protein